MKRIVITGARGFVAGHVLALQDAQVELHGVSRGARVHGRSGIPWHVSDLRDADNARELFNRVQPDAVIHLAAIADIDYCKAHPIEAQEANVGMTANLATACAATGTRLVYVSTDNLFDGEAGRYTENDEAVPVNEYGRSKLTAEERVYSHLDDFVIARVALVVGLPAVRGGNSFLARMIPALAAGKTVGVPANEIRSPIDVVCLARSLVELATNDYRGIVHLAGNEVLSRLDMVREIAAYLGHDRERIRENDPRSIPGRDERPRDVSLDNTRARSILKTRFLGLLDGLENAGIVAAKA